MFSLEPVPFILSVESENTGLIVLTCFVLILRAVYRYAWIFFFNPEISGLALSLILVRFYFFD